MATQQPCGHAHRLLVVIGPSASGKSGVVRELHRRA
jgi:guanylate kinase